MRKGREREGGKGGGREVEREGRKERHGSSKKRE